MRCGQDWLSSYVGYISTSLGQYLARSSSVASRAVRSSTSFLICTWTFGLALRFRYHIGFLALPPLDAATTPASPSRWKDSGLMRGCPLLRPVVVRSATGMPWKLLPKPSPSLRRYIKVLIFDIHLMKKSAGFVSMKRGRDFGIRRS